MGMPRLGGALFLTSAERGGCHLRPAERAGTKLSHVLDRADQVVLQQGRLLSDRDRRRDGALHAQRREDKTWLRIPPANVERSGDNPDGRNHLCAPPPNIPQGDVVFRARCRGVMLGF